MNTPATSRVHLVTIAELADADVPRFQEYEQLVLPVLAEYGELHQRMHSRIDDTCTHIHLMSFPDHESVQRFRVDPRRVAAQRLLRGLTCAHRLLDPQEDGTVSGPLGVDGELTPRAEATGTWRTTRPALP